MIQRQQGFTLIELMIAVVIIGILASIAVPNYQKNIKKARREDAKGALVSFATAMERHYTENSSYCDAAESGIEANVCGNQAKKDKGAPAIFAKQSPIDGETKFYNLTIHAVSDTPISYELHAKPIGDQADDECGTLTIKHNGERGAKNTGCW